MSVPYSAIAKFKYEPDPENANDDLPLAVGQLVTVVEIVDDDWLLGEYTDDSGNVIRGYFPKAFVDIYTPPAEQALPTASEQQEPETKQPIVVDEQDEEAQSSTGNQFQTLQKSNDVSDFKNSNAQAGDIESSIVHEPENFKNKLQAFNISSTPIMPNEKPIEENFVKKSFTVSEHRSSYIPPSFGTSKPVRKEEKIPDVISGEVISEASKTDEVEAPRMTLKERMMLLQKQQQEEQKALEAAMKRKEEKKKARHTITRTKTEESLNHEAKSLHEGQETESLQEILENSDIDSGNQELHYATPIKENAQESNENYEIHNERFEEEEEEEEEENGKEAEKNDVEDEESEEEDDGDDDEEDEEDEEELRKRRLAERMAKLSGGMGMMGMMGMMPQAPVKTTAKKVKKSNKEKKEESENVEAVPILPMAPGIPPMMGMPMPGMFTAGQDPGNAINEGDQHETSSQSMEDHRDAVLEGDNNIGSDSEAFDNSTDEEGNFQDTFESPQQTVLPSTPNMSHPYKQFSTSGTPSAPSTITHPPPPLPPTDTNLADAIPQAAPPIPNLQSMPKTVSHMDRPPMPPPPETSVPSVPTPSTSCPPPAPGSAPPIPTQTQMAPPVPSSIPQPAPVSRPAPPPIPGNESLSRHSSVFSRPPAPAPPVPTGAPSIPAPVPASVLPNVQFNTQSAPQVPPHATIPDNTPKSLNRHSTLGHPPPPPPPSESIPEIPDESAPLRPVIQKQLTRTSLGSIAASSTESVTPSVNNEQWWINESLPPQFKSSDCYFEVDVTDITKRGGRIVKYLIYYILDVHLTCVTIELAYDTSEPERILFFHESKDKTKSDSKILMKQYNKYGPLAYNTAIKTLNQSFNGEYINFIFQNLPSDALRPISNKTFGGVVYRNNNGDTKFFEEIRPGDILVLVNALFETHHGDEEVGVQQPHVALVTNFDKEKNKIKVIEQTDGVVKQGRYKLTHMKSGKLRVFRIVGRDYVGW